MKLRKSLYIVITLAVTLSVTMAALAVNSAVTARYVTRGTITLRVSEPVAGLEFFVTALNVNGAEFREFIYEGSPENPLDPVITVREQNGGVWIAVFSDYNGFGDAHKAVTLGTLVFDNRSDDLNITISDTAAYKADESGHLTRVEAECKFQAEIPEIDSGDSDGGSSEEDPEETAITDESPAEPELPAAYEFVTFTDLTEAEWARSAIEYLASVYGFSGIGNGIFAPNAPITRAQFARFTSIVFGIRNTASGMLYTDVHSGDWFAEDVNALSSAGIIKGFPDGTFRPGELITREQMAAMIVRAANALGLELSPMRPFVLTDISEAGEWAQDAIRALYRCGGIEGMENDRFEPLMTATRAQACVILYRLVRLLELQPNLMQ
ncbi:MAG: S-layer homology domain-containing protein [Oscillospiraceae bacterium]|jgi:hypothetical protein|nr:S-layer homology domain-containing protein [Oscillospiraceae bacterium]